ncbi:serine hydrolase domain-containing protein [Ulvibacterium marinum]|uniref:Class C beta-lactamase-related serine hydrolase n=1 Tax=Ulvibacterium marinum TaxID=2419782 RepID=A0A3B0C0H0_9FLAO|nr:serine hydrolase [Ulvibacterium marinum]RKN79295.1 class C beta-lactamase-related serine hydrolase [Ulvibacterium marinum]
MRFLVLFLWVVFVSSKADRVIAQNEKDWIRAPREDLVAYFKNYGDNYFPKEAWRTDTPQSQGLDGGKLQDLVRKIRNNRILRPITSLVIVKNGYLVVNERFGEYEVSKPHTLQSVTKSITSTLVGVAIQQGFIQGLDQKILDFFPEYQTVENDESAKRAMNLQNALNMRTGQAWTGERHLGPLNQYKGDRMKYVLDYEMELAPGKKWHYNSGIAILVGGLLQNATGMDTKDFAQQFLFGPLSIKSAQWSWGHKGIPHTGGGLFLTPIDLARIGYLYLRNGCWEGQQIFPEDWIHGILTNAVPLVKKFHGGIPAGYGGMWWLLPLEKTKTKNSFDILMAYGHWGQFLFVIPQYDMVIVMTQNDSATYSEEIGPIKLLYSHLLPMVKK